MTIARACRPPAQNNTGGWQAAGGLLSTLLGSRSLHDGFCRAAACTAQVCSHQGKLHPSVLSVGPL